MTPKYLTGALLAIIFHSAAMCQQQAPDTAFLASARQYQQSLYDASIRGQSRLYNGTQHLDYLSRNDEHPYFNLDDWQFGFMYYDDERYDSVAMFYDLSRDVIITEHLLTGAKIELISRKISAFEIGNHYFERILKDSSGTLTEGFYERLYNGTPKVYARRTKTLSSRASANQIEYSFDQRNRIYLYKDGIYHPVKTKRSVLRVLDDRKHELRAALKQQNIRYKVDRERAIVLMAQTYHTTYNTTSN